MRCIAVALFAAMALAGSFETVAQDATPKPPADYKGTLKLDVRESKPDWGPFTPKRAPDGAPNVLIILYDDTGLAAWSPYGGRIRMPTMQRLAENGVTYTQWHTTALRSGG